MNNALLQNTPSSSAGQMAHTAQLTQSLNLASQLAPSLGHSQVIPAHLLLVLLEDSDISFLLNAYGVDIKEAKTSVLKLFPKITPKAAANNQKVPHAQAMTIVLNHAAQNAQKNNLPEINSTFMFATLLREDNAFSNILEDYDLSYEGVAQFIEMQTGSNISIDPVPAYTIDDSVFVAPPPSAAMPTAAPAQAAVPNAAPSAAQAPQAKNISPPAAPPQPTPAQSKVISFSNILKRQDDDITPPQTAQQAALQQTPLAQPLTSQHIPATTTPPQQAQTQTNLAPPPSMPQGVNTTFSASGSVIEKGVLIVPEHLTLKVGKPHIVEVRIAHNPQAMASNASYDEIVMEALTTQLHAPGQNFHIKSLLPETHWIENVAHNTQADYGHWQWEVTPLQRGATKLSLVVSSRTLNKDNQLSSISLPEKSIDISVGMNSASLMIKLFFLATLIGLGIAAYLFLLPRFM